MNVLHTLKKDVFSAVVKYRVLYMSVKPSWFDSRSNLLNSCRVLLSSSSLLSQDCEISNYDYGLISPFSSADFTSYILKFYHQEHII